MNNIIYFKPAKQTENIGDLLINLVEVDLLRPYGQIVIDDSSTPAWFVEEISTGVTDQRLSQISAKPLIKTLASQLWKEKFSSDKKNQYYMVIQPGHTSRQGFKAAYSSFRLNSKMFLLKLLGCRILRIGFSIGPFDNYNGWVESFGSLAYHFYAVRDHESLKIAQKYHFKRPQYFPDLAWAYAPEKTEKTGLSEYIVVSLRSNAYGKTHDSAYLKPLMDSLRALLISSKQQNVKLVVTYQVKYDRDACVEIYETFKNEFNTEFVDSKLTLKEANLIYGNAKFVISNRLHVLLLALKCGALSFPLVDVNDNKKITSIFQDNNLKDLILDVKENVAINSEKLEKSLSDRDGVMAEFKKIQAKNKSVIEQDLSNIFK